MDGYKYDQLSTEIEQQNYLAPGEKTREDIWKRNAKSTASVEKEDEIEKYEQEFYDLLKDDKFIPGGRTLANNGVESRKATTQFNCFVHNPADIGMKDPDSIEGIYNLLKAQAQTLKSEGGYGINASFIRPAGTYIDGIGARTPGVLKFMELWDKSSEIITQGSTKVLGPMKENEKLKLRKGAQMLVLNIWHPDVEEFIVAKQTPGRLTKFNLSVGITDGFMDAVKNDSTWDLVFPDTTHPKYKDEWNGILNEWVAKGYTTITHKTVKAKDLWDAITTATYNRAEPGILFLDKANLLNPISYTEVISQSNPCGEIVMSTGVCNLCSVNLPMFISVKDGVPEFDWVAYSKAISLGVRFLDNINTISTTPLPEYDKAVKEKRRIGLGNMGLGSLHFILGFKYGSKESLEFVEKLYKTKTEVELLASAKLGKEKGSFELFDREKYFSSYWWKNLKISEEVKKEIEEIGEMRNSHQSMNAPTGNTGIYARNVSGGIEPVFSKGYSRWTSVVESTRSALVLEGFQFPDITKGEWFETKDVKFAMRGNEQILKGSFNGENYEVDKSRGLVVENKVMDYGWRWVLSNVSPKVIEENEKKGIYATTQSLSVQDHLSVLAVIAHYTNQSNSKTINIPHDYSFEDFKNVYMTAYDNNIKGVTTYREGTMTAVLETGDNVQKNDKCVFEEKDAPKRPEIMDCDIFQVKISGESWTIFIGLFEGKPFEIFGGLSKYLTLSKKITSGKIQRHPKKKGQTRAVYDLHCGDEKEPTIVKDIVKVFENATQSEFTRILSLALRHGSPLKYVVDQLQKDEESDMYSFSKVIARVLKNYIKDGTKVTGKVCLSCGSSNLTYQEGCAVCLECGHSRCG